MSFSFADVKSIILPEGDVLSITDGNGTVIWEKNKKETYTLLSYIQGTGTQYIDTGLLHTSLDEHYLLDLEIDTPIQQNIIFSNGNDVAINLYVQSSTRGTMYAKYGKTSYSSRTNINPSSYMSRGIWRLLNGSLIKGSSTIMNPTMASSIPAQSGTLKLLTSDGTSCISGKIHSYGFQVYDNNTGITTMRLLPAMRDSDNEVGLYDEDNDVFYTNAGSGSFIAGNPI